MSIPQDKVAGGGSRKLIRPSLRNRRSEEGNVCIPEAGAPEHPYDRGEREIRPEERTGRQLTSVASGAGRDRAG